MTSITKRTTTFHRTEFLSFFASNDPIGAESRKPKINPPVGPKRAESPPPDVKIGSPIAPNTIYMRIEEKEERGGRRRAAKKTKSVCNVIGTGNIGILINAPAATRAENKEISIIMAKE